LVPAAACVVGTKAIGGAVFCAVVPLAVTVPLPAAGLWPARVPAAAALPPPPPSAVASAVGGDTGGVAAVEAVSSGPPGLAAVPPGGEGGAAVAEVELADAASTESGVRGRAPAPGLGAVPG
jgi:hypothetical protein